MRGVPYNLMQMSQTTQNHPSHTSYTFTAPRAWFRVFALTVGNGVCGYGVCWQQRQHPASAMSIALGRRVEAIFNELSGNASVVATEVVPLTTLTLPSHDPPSTEHLLPTLLHVLA